MLQFLRELGSTKLAILVAAIVAVLIVFGFLATKVSQKNLTPLYNNLTLEDSSEIVSELESQNIPYKLAMNGTQILIPQDKVLRLRLSFAEQGIPSSGSIVGYEIFDNSKTLGTSNFVHNVNLMRALEGELGRTISSFESVETARVHLVMPKREMFSRKTREPTASVILKLRGADNFTKSQVNAVTHLVSTAVPGLKPNKVTIVDTAGKTLNRGGADDDDPGALASTAEEYTIAYEKRIKGAIEALLERSLGLGRVIVEVSADIDFDRIVTNSEIFDPEGQVKRSVQVIEEKESSSENSSNENVSVDNNLPDASAGEAGSGSETSSERIDETTNYEISKTVKNHIRETGTVNRLSVAVLVDGTYEIGEDKEVIAYIPRTNDELEKIRLLVTSAVGFDMERGDKLEVVNMQFDRDMEALKGEKPFDWIKRDFRSLVQTLIIGLVVVLVILLIIKPMLNRAFDLTKAEADEEALQQALKKEEFITQLEEDNFETITSESIINIDELEGRVKETSVKSVNEIIREFPDEAVSLLRNWIYGEDH